MSRAEQRMKKALEKNAIEECNKILKKFYPRLFEEIGNIHDPRNQSYVKYPSSIMLGSILYKNIVGIVSMRDMNDKFNDEIIVKNVSSFCGVEENLYLPHAVTINEYLERINTEEIQEIEQDIIRKMVRRRSFQEAKFMGKWLIIIDGTQLYSGSRKINEKCLERHYNKETEKETVNYYTSVLEAKIYFGNNFVASIASEFIENNGEDTISQKEMNREEIKQDCEIKAFKRIAEKLNSIFSRLPICLLLDSLYASEPVMNICKENKWDYIIRFKDGSIPSIAEEYEAIPEKQNVDQCEYINEIDYKGNKINMLKYRESRNEDKGKRYITFQWITNIEISKKNVRKIAEAGRKRWKIENQGFNRQKNWQNDITHACSWNENALKCHYLMTQIADFFKQLYEIYFLEKNEIQKKQKNISSDLLKSLGQHKTRDDTFLKLYTQSICNN